MWQFALEVYTNGIILAEVLSQILAPLIYVAKQKHAGVKYWLEYQGGE